jgi:hypothetical protein
MLFNYLYLYYAYEEYNVREAFPIFILLLLALTIRLTRHCLYFKVQNML